MSPKTETTDTHTTNTILRTTNSGVRGLACVCFCFLQGGEKNEKRNTNTMADVNAEGPKKVEAENNNQTAPASPKPGPVVDQAQGEDRRTVFVKGIPQNYNEDQLCALFQAFGVVESSRIMVDQQTSQILDKGSASFPFFYSLPPLTFFFFFLFLFSFSR